MVVFIRDLFPSGVTLVRLVLAGVGQCRCGGEDLRQEKEENSPHGELPKRGTASGLSLLPSWMTAQAGQKGVLIPFSDSTVGSLPASVL